MGQSFLVLVQPEDLIYKDPKQRQQKETGFNEKKPKTNRPSMFFQPKMEHERDPHSMSAPSSNQSALSQENHSTEAITESPEEDENPMKNPFTINPDTKIFSMRYKERQKAKAERAKMKTMKIHEKTTYSTKMKAQSKWFRKAMRQEEEEDAKRQAGSEERLETLQKMLSQNLAIKCDYPQKRQTRQEYKHAIREAFLLEYAMAVKREKIQRIKDIIEHEERELEKATQQLEKDASMFYEYLKKKQEKIVQVLTDARKATEAHTKKKRELEAINSQIENLKSDIAELKNTLQEYKTRKDFLYEQLPKEWQEKHGEKHKQDLRTLSKANEESASPPTTAEPGKGVAAGTNAASYSHGPSSLQSLKGLDFKSLHDIEPELKDSLKPLSEAPSLEDAETEISSDEDEEPQLYFTDPQQLLSIFMEQEEKVLSLIQHSTESEQSMDNILTKCNSLDKMAAELKQQVDALKSSIAKEEAKAADLRRKVLALSPGEDEEDDQDRMIKSLHNKVQEVYSQCTGDSETNLQTEQMLTVIERHVYKLLDNLEKIPPAKLEQILGVKKKEQWVRLRKKRRQEKQQQEERLKRALDRSLPTINKPTGRRPTFHSVPSKKKKRDSQEQTDTEKEEQL